MESDNGSNAASQPESFCVNGAMWARLAAASLASAADQLPQADSLELLL